MMLTYGKDTARTHHKYNKDMGFTGKNELSHTIRY